MNPNLSLAIITQSDKMRSILAQVEAISGSDSTVLLIGETGVGKELFADYIHRTSPRRNRLFVKIALSAMPHELLESELFGHERGSFTSAVNEKKGLFELAHTGSLFLDDIDDVPLPMQAKLLRVLESQEVMRVGGTSATPVDVRLIAASKVNLKELVDHGSFRADLYYRINVFPVQIPSLRERREDVTLLVNHFLNRFAPDKGLSLSQEASEAFLRYHWPGNVRELRNIVQRLAFFGRDKITLQDLPPELCDGHPVQLLVKACTKCFREESLQFNDVISCLEVNLLKQALEETDGNRSQAAKVLGLSLSTMRDKLKKYGLENHSESPKP